MDFVRTTLLVHETASDFTLSVHYNSDCFTYRYKGFLLNLRKCCGSKNIFMFLVRICFGHWFLYGGVCILLFNVLPFNCTTVEEIRSTKVGP